MTPDTGLPGSGIAPAGPLLGNLLQVKLNRIHRDVEGWCRQYGKLFRIAFGPFKVLVVADPALITVILRERPGRFRRPSRSAEVALEMSGNLGLFMAEADDWRRQRSRRIFRRCRKSRHACGLPMTHRWRRQRGR